MSSSPQEPSVSSNWDVYWRGTHENSAHKDGGPQEAVLAEFWKSVFEQLPNGLGNIRILDLACGNGAVTGIAMKVLANGEHFCLDSSLSAVLELRKRYPGSICTTADAQRTPFASGSFGIVCSQFGLEYAGWEAIGEAVRLLAPQGTLALVLHLHSGAIYQECSQSLRAIEAIQEINILPLAFTAFGAGFALNAGSGTVAEFKKAEKKFTPAVRGLEAIMAEMGSDVAAGLPRQLYRDISHMYQNMSAFNANEVASWVEGMTKELDAYRGRMSSMISAALDHSTVDKMIDLVTSQGVTVVGRSTLKMGSTNEPSAWALVCRRGV